MKELHWWLKNNSVDDRMTLSVKEQ